MSNYESLVYERLRVKEYDLEGMELVGQYEASELCKEADRELENLRAELAKHTGSAAWIIEWMLAEKYNKPDVPAIVVRARKAYLETMEENKKLIAQNTELLAALGKICGTIDAHEIESLSCDNDGEKYCDCLQLANNAAKQAIARAKS